MWTIRHTCRACLLQLQVNFVYRMCGDAIGYLELQTRASGSADWAVAWRAAEQRPTCGSEEWGMVSVIVGGPAMGVVVAVRFVGATANGTAGIIALGNITLRSMDRDLRQETSRGTWLGLGCGQGLGFSTMRSAWLETKEPSSWRHKPEPPPCPTPSFLAVMVQPPQQKSLPNLSNGLLPRKSPFLGRTPLPSCPSYGLAFKPAILLWIPE